MAQASLSWLSIVRLGLVQSALGAVVVLTTSTLNRVMVVELALPAMLPAGLVAWHYAVQLSRPKWGHAADLGGRRTPWIIGGIAVLALGGTLAAAATAVMATSLWSGIALGVLAFSLIGAGVGAAGTSLLALLAAASAPQRRPAAAAIAWIMMILGIVMTAGIAGALLDPYSPQRLTMVAAGVCLIAFLLALAGVAGVERRAAPAAARQAPQRKLVEALKEVWADGAARLFTGFVFLSMLAYSAQDLILEPFAGLIFNMTPGQSTQMSGMQHGGVLIGMLIVGGFGGVRGGHSVAGMRTWTLAGCLGSAVALLALAIGGTIGPGWPLAANVFALGLANGVFAVSAIGAMMSLAGGDGGGREGTRMGVWGAAQAIAFGCGGFLGAAGVDVLRPAMGADAPAFMVVFAIEAGLFALAAALALKIGACAVGAARAPALPAEAALGG